MLHKEKGTIHGNQVREMCCRELDETTDNTIKQRQETERLGDFSLV
jgi:hypothetical protein